LFLLVFEVERVKAVNKKILCAAVVLFITGCSSSGHQAAVDAHADAPAHAKQLSGSEINSTVIGRKHSSVTSTGYPFSETLSPDGTARIQISSESMQSGTWVITEDVICITYQKYGKECNKVLSDGVTIWFVDSVKNTTNNKFTAH
jgi:PBP1b-binding outer membrane lipoprotein LpoB